MGNNQGKYLLTLFCRRFLFVSDIMGLGLSIAGIFQYTGKFNPFNNIESGSVLKLISILFR
jgi:hypothetical protein